MERKYALSLISTLFLFIFLISCSPKAQAPLKKPETGAGIDIGQALQEKASEWDKILTLAKKERTISLYSVADGELKVALIKVMREKFGLDLNFVTGRAAEINLKILNERKAGVFDIDVYIGGGSIVNDLKPAGVFDPMGSQLFLPEVVDSKNWWGGELLYLDKDKQILAMAAFPSPPLAINANLVNKEEVKSYLDLLNPKWKGKMILNDPSTPGAAQYWFAAVSSKIMNLDYMRRLAQMDLTVTRDQRLQLEWLSQGKFPIAIAAQQSTANQFQKDGAPIELITPKEGSHLNSSSGNIAIVNNASHTYAAKLFINWLLTREGQTIFSTIMGFQSVRLDVPTTHLPSDNIRNPDVKYFSAINEEFIKSLPQYAKIAQEIFGPFMK